MNRKRNLARLSRPAETPLRATGPASSPRHSRDRTLPSSSPMSVQDLAPLPLPVPLALLLSKPSPRRRRRSPRRTSIWAISSVVVKMTTEEVVEQ